METVGRSLLTPGGHPGRSPAAGEVLNMLPPTLSRMSLLRNLFADRLPNTLCCPNGPDKAEIYRRIKMHKNNAFSGRPEEGPAVPHPGRMLQKAYNKSFANRRALQNPMQAAGARKILNIPAVPARKLWALCGTSDNKFSSGIVAFDT